MNQYKPKVNTGLTRFERIRWILEIKKGMDAIKASCANGYISNESYMKWMVIREAEVRWNEFYLTHRIVITFNNDNSQALIDVISGAINNG